MIGTVFGKGRDSIAACSHPHVISFRLRFKVYGLGPSHLRDSGLLVSRISGLKVPSFGFEVRNGLKISSRVYGLEVLHAEEMGMGVMISS